MVYNCGSCSSVFTRKDNLRRHIQRYHIGSEVMEKCFLCGMLFKSVEEFNKHATEYHKSTNDFTIRDNAFNKSIAIYRYVYQPDIYTMQNAQNAELQKAIVNLLLTEANVRKCLKTSLILIANMEMKSPEGDTMLRASVPFRSQAFIINANSEKKINKVVEQAFIAQNTHMEEFCLNGSNWIFQHAVAFDVEIATVKPLRIGGEDCGRSQRLIKNSKYLFDPKTNKHCFKYCIASYLTETNSMKMIKAKAAQFNMENIEEPITIQAVKKFLKQNVGLSLNINILLLGQDNMIYPHEYGLGSGSKTVNLLLSYSTKDDNTKCGHFMLINNLDKFLRKTYNNNTFKKDFFCPHCLNAFSRFEVRNNHEKICCMHKPVVEIVPDKENAVLKFNKFENQCPVEMIAFLDFECVLPIISDENICAQCESLKCKCDLSYTKPITNQEVFCYSFIIIDQKNKILFKETYSGNDAVKQFIEVLLELESDINTRCNTSINMSFTSEDFANFQAATKCYLCEKNFSSDVIKCRDHNHSNGKYINAACAPCNLRRRRQKKLKIFVHNGSRYDFHFIIKELSNYPNLVNKLDVVGFNTEHFRTFSFKCYQFLDSIAFLQSSLASLSQDLSETDHDYQILKSFEFVQNDDKTINYDKFTTCLKKNFFPYEFCTSLELMRKTTKPPPQTAFYSKLSETTISDDDYAFVLSVWKMFNIQNLEDYAKLYCMIDTILLAEIFQKFRLDMLKFSSLDPAHYISLPSFSFDAMLKITKCQLELLCDIDMVQFIEYGIRGGLSYINTRHLTIENSANESIQYIDANNLYGHAQMQSLPLKNFKWMSEREIEQFDVKNYDNDSDVGYILMVDLKYPAHLHKMHNDYPLAPECIRIKHEHLSQYAQDNCFSKSYSDIKLSSTLHDKCKYVVHIKNLKLYLSLGLQLTKIHKGLKFEQKPFLVPFISKCTEARKISNTKFEKDQFKKIANSTYGKTVENVREYCNIKMHSNSQSLMKAVSKPTYKSSVIITESLVLTSHSQPFVLHNKPISIGFTILDLSKEFMYDFYYNKLKSSKAFNIDLGFTDTDSFLFKVDNTSQYYKHLENDMDFSNYPKSHKLYNTNHQNALGYFKNELCGTNSCVEFIGLRSKCYAMKIISINKKLIEKKVCKGIGRVAIRNRLNFDQYKKVLFKHTIQRHHFHTIRSKKQQISTIKQNKIALSHFDSKRWILSCGIHSVPYGSTHIQIYNNKCHKCV